MASHPQAHQPQKSPPLQHLVRTADGVYTLYDTPRSWPNQWKEKVSRCINVSNSDTMVAYAKDGSLYAVSDGNKVRIYDSKSLKVIQTINNQDSEILDFSPQNSYLVTYERTRRKGGPNMIIWDLATGKDVRRLYQKDYILDRKPLIWSQNEDILLHLVKNRVNIYNGHDPNVSIGDINVKGVSAVYLSPGAPDNLYIAIFVPEMKNSMPARISIYKYPEVETATATKSLFKAQEVSIKWNSTGSALLAQTSTEVSNDSYYGEIGLHLMHTDGEFQCTVTFGTNKGPLQSTAWSPTKNEFFVIQGFQPAKITLFCGKTCAAKQSYGTSSRNHVIWSPHGRFVCFGAFDNLGTGEMDFWDKNKMKVIGTCKDMDAPSMWEWTPDSRHFVTAVLYPRRRTDNGYKAWSYCGELLYHQKVEKIKQVAIRPSLPGVYPDRPMSPRLANKKPQKIQKSVSAPKAYIPPHLRSRGVGPSTIMKTATEKAEKIKMSQKETAARNKLRNQKRRDRKKAAKQKEEEEKRAEEERKAEGERKKNIEMIKSDTTLKNKKIKKIKKTLRQINGLKQKQEDGQVLNSVQLEKIKKEASLMEILQELEL